MPSFMIDNVLITKNDFDYAEHLKTAYLGKINPLCMCLSPGIPMYIAHIADSYILKRMPNSGCEHHIDCESYEIPSALSGRGDLCNSAIVEDHDTGITNLKLDFALTKNNTSRLAPTGECGQKTTIKSTPSKLSLRSLLHYLYEEAGLNKWFPRMEGKRNWYVVRKFLLNEIHNKQAKNAPLSKAIVIPEVFSVDNKDQINKRIQQYMASLKPEGKKQPVSILIGEVKKIEKARFEHRLIVKHMPETPFYLGEDVCRRIYRNFGFEMALFEQQESIHLLTICTFFLSPSGSPQIDSISFMLADSHWLPIESVDDVNLTEVAVTEKRSFIKGLRYNLASNEVIAAMLLTDMGDSPTAIYISPFEATDDFKENLGTVISESDLSSYVWDIDSSDPLRLPSKPV